MAILPVGLFMPLPLPMMIPFMAAQSAAMARAFGENFQYGKRKISALSNEEFNKLTPQQLMIDFTRDLQNAIPEMEKQLRSMAPMTKVIIEEFRNIIVDAGSAVEGLITTGGLGGSPQPTGDMAALLNWLQGLVSGDVTPPADAALPPSQPIPPPVNQNLEIDLQQAKFNNYMLKLTTLTYDELIIQGHMIAQRHDFTPSQRVTAGKLIIDLQLKLKPNKDKTTDDIITGDTGDSSLYKGVSTQTLKLALQELLITIRSWTDLYTSHPLQSKNALSNADKTILEKLLSDIKKMEKKARDITAVLEMRANK